MIKKADYVVLDVETNGLSSKRDNLLSISIYMPDKEVFLDRFLPLELQDRVLTTDINGITSKMLRDSKPISQAELDSIIENFELNKRTILTYGKLDKTFVKEYLCRHKLNGFEKFTFYNIKDDIISTAYTNGLLTKDNLCIALGIDGVSSVHSGHNDCVLEWKLFEKMNGKKLFVSYTADFCPKGINHKRENWYIYELTNEYIVPVSYLHSHPKIIKSLKLPKIEIKHHPVFEHRFSKKCSSEYTMQPAGIASEHLIKTMLDATPINNYPFLAENKRKLKYLGSIEAEEPNIVFYSENDDGTIKAVDKQFKKYVEALNKQTIAIKKEIGPVIEFIKNEIFRGEEIFSQEMIINNHLNILGLCDFSNSHACLEAKWVSPINKKYYDEYKYQLYITSNNRPCYLIVGSEDTLCISKVEFEIC